MSNAMRGTGWFLAVAALLAMLALGIAREVPRGGLRGTLVMQENGRPLPGATIWLHRVDPLTVEDAEADSVRVRTDREGRFEARGVPAGVYRVDLTARAHRFPDEERRIAIEEGKVTAVRWVAEPVEPFLQVYRSQLVAVPGEGVRLEVHGFVRQDELQLRAYQLDVMEVARRGGLQRALEPIARKRFEEVSPSDRSLAQLVHSSGLPIRNRDAEGVFVEMVSLGALPEGLYLVQVQAGQTVLGTFASVSRLAMIAKNDGQRIEVLATDLVTGRPVEGVSLGVVQQTDARTEVVPQGATDAQGRATLRSGGSRNPVVYGMKGPSAAFVGNLWNYSDPPSPYRVHWQTDRPVYRPGDRVYFKGIVRRRDGGAYVVPRDLPVALELRNEQDDVLQRLQVRLDDAGTFAGSVATLPESPPGAYRLKAAFEGTESSTLVWVQAYRKPEIEVIVRPESPNVVRGTAARVLVEARAFFGAPVAGTKFSLSVSRRPVWPVDPAFSDSPFEGESGGEYLESFDGTTDAAGRCWIEIPTVWPSDPQGPAEYDEIYDVHVVVEPGQGPFVEASGSFKVVRGDLDLRCLPVRFVGRPGSDFPVDVTAQDHQGNPGAGVEVVAELQKVLWIGKRQQLQPLGTVSGKTDETGRATLVFRPRLAGSLRVSVRAKDRSGREILAQAELWAEGDEAVDDPAAPSLALLSDRAEYSDRDTARVLIRTNNPGGFALVSLEADRIYRAWAVELKEQVTAVDIPLSGELRPNVFVSVAYVRGKSFAEASRVLRISAENERLEVRVIPQAKVFEPGQTVEFAIETLHDGRPVAADACVALVDEAVFSIREDETDILESFYPRRYNAVSTGYSFPELYLDGGDKAPPDLRVRRDFRDTAYWQANLRTGSDGRASLLVRLPDNLTQWRATVTAASLDTRVGKGVAKIRVRKPLMVRLHTPPLQVAGDRLPLLATLTNDTGHDQRIRLVLDVRGIAVDGRRSLEVDVPKGAERSVRWRLQADTPGKATLTARAWVQGGPSDGVEAQVSVVPAARLQPGRSSGSVDGRADISFDWEPGGTGYARVTITPDARWAIVQALDELLDYPYGCVEQTLSRFVPAVVADGLVRKGLVPPFQRQSEIPRMVAAGFALLRSAQGSGGGWGWWPGDAPNPTMTAMVLEGLALARLAGHEPPTSLAFQGAEAARAMLSGRAYFLPDEGKGLKPDDRAFLAWGLLALGEDPVAVETLARLRPRDLSPVGLSHAILACHKVGRGLSGRLAGFLAELRSRAQGTDLKHWTQEAEFGVEPTARALLALATVDPQDPWIPSIARYLMERRRGNGWFSTRDTAAVVMALGGSLRGPLPDLAGRLVSIELNGEEIGRLSLGGMAQGRGALRFDLPLSRLQAGRNRLTVRSEAPVYWALETLQSVRSTVGRAVPSADLSVERAYSLLRLERMSDGGYRAMPDRRPRTAFSKGDTVLCTITLRASKPLEFVVVEDPLPAGWVPLASDRPEGSFAMGDLWSAFQARDDRMNLFLREVPRGVHRVSYLLRAESEGSSIALPTTAYPMYDPDSRAGGALQTLEVRGR
ncbi:MAG: MG2 domain-containing protein [Fimbriimonadales bacterium]|nr:MG2 domain-containing protein [Fimbriimonadales bacterium]